MSKSKALKIAFIIIIIAVMAIVTLLKYQVSSEADAITFLEKLFIDDLATEYLGALISILVFYLFLYAIGKSINSLINNETESEIQVLSNEINLLKEQFHEYAKSISEKIDSINHEIKIIQPKGIETILEKSRQETDFWYFSGGTGTYTKAVTLPILSKKARELGKSINIDLLIINPLNPEICGLYAQLRSSLRPSDKDGLEWTNDYVRNHSLATIVLCYALSSENKLLNISIGLKNHFSLFRFDISSNKVLITKEDPKDLAMLFNKNSFTYDSYKSDFQQTFEQTQMIINFKKIKNKIRLEHLDKTKIKQIFTELSLDVNISESDYDSVLELSKTYKNPYGKLAS